MQYRYAMQLLKETRYTRADTEKNGTHYVLENQNSSYYFPLLSLSLSLVNLMALSLLLYKTSRGYEDNTGHKTMQ